VPSRAFSQDALRLRCEDQETKTKNERQKHMKLIETLKEKQIQLLAQLTGNSEPEDSEKGTTSEHLRERLLASAESMAWDEKQISLALHLECSPDELTEESHDHYGMTIYSLGSQEYSVGTDDEADSAWDQELDNYIEDCIEPELEKVAVGNLAPYIKFDSEMWKRDARHDGRGHALSRYDGDEIELDGDLYAYRLN
jgi:hypothetical protein